MKLNPFPVIPLWRDLAMVNSMAKSSNLCLSHVHFHRGVPHGCITSLLYLMLLWSSKTGPWLHLQTRHWKQAVRIEWFERWTEDQSLPHTSISSACLISAEFKMATDVTLASRTRYRPVYIHLGGLWLCTSVSRLPGNKFNLFWMTLATWLLGRNRREVLHFRGQKSVI